MQVKKILVVDDDVSIGNMLEEMLKREGYAVLHAYSGTEALLLLRENEPDLALLDLMLPGMSGEEVLPHLQGIPVIVMSARAEVDDKVDLLLGGAADYVTKPFSGKELLARIAVQLRGREEKVKSELYYEGISLNIVTGQCFAEGREIRLTRTEYAILKLLMANPSQIIARSVMLERVSEDTPDCTEASLKVHISHLRAKLREAVGEDMIETVWGIGFRLRILTQS